MDKLLPNWYVPSVEGDVAVPLLGSRSCSGSICPPDVCILAISKEVVVLRSSRASVKRYSEACYHSGFEIEQEPEVQCLDLIKHGDWSDAPLTSNFVAWIFVIGTKERDSDLDRLKQRSHRLFRSFSTQTSRSPLKSMVLA